MTKFLYCNSYSFLFSAFGLISEAYTYEKFSIPIKMTEVKFGCVRSATRWATFQINDESNSLCHPLEGTLNYGSLAWLRHAQ